MSGEDLRQGKFRALVAAYGSDLYRYAMWICGNDALAKDLVQETFLRAWKALDNLKDEGAAKSWLITILRREFARTFERKVPKFTDVETIEVPEETELEPDDSAEIQLFAPQHQEAAVEVSRAAAVTGGDGAQLRRNSARAANQQKRSDDAIVPGT